MLDGFTELTPGDCRSSLAFIGELRRTGIIPQRDIGTHCILPSPTIPAGKSVSQTSETTTATSASIPVSSEPVTSAPAVTSSNSSTDNNVVPQQSESAQSLSNSIASISIAANGSPAAQPQVPAPERRLCRAIDCGAGIGRVTKNVLLISFDAVDMAELSERSLAAAPAYIGRDYSRVERTYCTRLQEFAPDAGRVYDVVWLQWVVGHLLDDDLVALLSRLKTALSPPAPTPANAPAAAAAADSTSDSDPVAIDASHVTATAPSTTTTTASNSRRSMPRNSRARRKGKGARADGAANARDAAVAESLRPRGPVAPGGVIVLKENVHSQDGATVADWVDERDSSIVRTRSHMKRIFARAGLTLLLERRIDADWFPRDFFPIWWFVLR